MGQELTNEVLSMRKALDRAEPHSISPSSMNRMIGMYSNIKNCVTEFKTQMESSSLAESDCDRDMLITQSVSAFRKHIRVGKLNWLSAKAEPISTAFCPVGIEGEIIHGVFKAKQEVPVLSTSAVVGVKVSNPYLNLMPNPNAYPNPNAHPNPYPLTPNPNP